MRVRDIVEMPVMRRGKTEVVAGRENLDREVRWMHIAESATDGVFKGGEFVLTTGVQLEKKTPKEQREFVRKLDGQGVVALAGPGRPFQSALSSYVIEEAEALGLPLFLFRRFVRFVEVTEAVHKELANSDYELLRWSERFRERFVQAALKGGGSIAVVTELATATGIPMVLEEYGGDLVQSPAEEDDDFVQALWLRLRASEERRDPVTPGYRSVPVEVRDRDWGRLIAFEVDGPIDEVTHVAMQRAAEVVALELVGEAYRREGNSASYEFLDDLVRGRLDGEGANQRAIALGFGASPGALLPFAAGWRSPRIATDPDVHAWDPLVPQIERTFREHGFSIVTTPYAGILSLVVDLPETSPSIERLGRLADIFFEAIKLRKGFDENQVALAIGAAQPDWTTIGQMLSSLDTSARAASTQPVRRWHDARNMSVADLLFGMADDDQLYTFVTQQLGPLLSIESQRNIDMLETLRALFAHGGHKAEAARSLFLNRQSFYYRLERIEEVLQVDLDSPDTALSLDLALRALPILIRKGKVIARIPAN